MFQCSNVRKLDRLKNDNDFVKPWIGIRRPQSDTRTTIQLDSAKNRLHSRSSFQLLQVTWFRQKWSIA
jgi:hypothetical protein